MAAKSKSKKAARPRTKRPKQLVIPGTEQQFDQSIEEAADNYYDVMLQSRGLAREADENKTALIEAMRAAKTDRYETADGLIVTVTAKSSLKCEKKAGTESNGQVVDLEE